MRAMGIAAVLAVCLAVPVRADKRSDAQQQFENAVRMRTMLEGYLEKDRTLSNYRQTVAAYHKVYLITPTADDVTPSLQAEAELYREMGRLFDPKYFQSAIDAYNFLIKQYPGSRYRGEALLGIAQIQNDDLKKTDDATATYTEYLKLFPHSEKAQDVRASLKAIAANRQASGDQTTDASAKPAGASASSAASATSTGAGLLGMKTVSDSKSQGASVFPDLKGQRVEPRVSDKDASGVTSIRTWNTQDSTRVIVALDDTINFSAARIASPDRIYFDLYKAKLTSRFPSKPLDVQTGLLKSLRFAQNKQGVVRLVIDVGGAKDYSAYLLSNPYRLVIEVGTQPVTTAQNAPAPVPAALIAPKAAAPVLAENIPNASDGTVAPASDSATLSSAAPPAAKPAAKTSAKPITLPIKKGMTKVVTLEPPAEPKPTRDGDRSLTRALGLKIGRIVIDPGHGGHDTGTIGPHGLMEKDLCLDVALRLGALIGEKLPGADVIYTRKDDTFIPLEERTAIANREKADLFISIHANSSQDPAARGIETYYLNFATSAESMEVASRENANSDESLHDLQDLIQKIARNEKIEESKELAGDIQDTLTQRMQLVSHSERNRGVKKAPFVVLIGANMPSVLSEISFVSNPSDEKLLRKNDQRDRIADGLYRGIATYLDNLNSLSYNKQKLISDNHVSDGRLDPAAVASAGNPK